MPRFASAADASGFCALLARTFLNQRSMTDLRCGPSKTSDEESILRTRRFRCGLVVRRAILLRGFDLTGTRAFRSGVLEGIFLFLARFVKEAFCLQVTRSAPSAIQVEIRPKCLRLLEAGGRGCECLPSLANWKLSVLTADRRLDRYLRTSRGFASIMARPEQAVPAPRSIERNQASAGLAARRGTSLEGRLECYDNSGFQHL